MGANELVETRISMLAFHRNWIEGELAVIPTALVVLGDSMEPNIWEGYVVLFDRAQTRVTTQSTTWSFLTEKWSNDSRSSVEPFGQAPGCERSVVKLRFATTVQSVCRVAFQILIDSERSA